MDSYITPNAMFGRVLTKKNVVQVSREIFENIKPTPSRELDNALAILLGKNAVQLVSYSTLSTILNLICRPKELRKLENTAVLPACMNLLRNYKNVLGDTKLFGREYGVLCFHILAMATQVGSLLHTGRFDAFVTLASGASNPQAIAAMLAEHVARAVETHAEIKQSKTGRDWLLGITESSHGLVFLKNVGGFLRSYTEPLLEAIWEDRDTLTRISINLPTPGWPFVLFVTEAHLQMDLVDEKFLPDENIWAMLPPLAFRFSLSAQDEENDFIQDVCVRANSVVGYFFKERDYEPSLVDSEDAQLVAETYIKRCTLTPLIKPLYIESLVVSIRFIFEDLVHELDHLIPRLLEVVLARLWAEITIRDRALTFSPNWQKEVVNYFINTLEQIAYLFDRSAFGTGALMSFSAALVKQDFVGLLGRVLLFPMEVSPLRSHIIRSPTESFIRTWSRTINAVRELILVLEENEWHIVDAFYVHCQDWAKIHAYIRCHIHHRKFEESHQYQKYLISLEETWASLGEALRFPEHLKKLSPCENPRCHDPSGMFRETGVRDSYIRCLTTTFCSTPRRPM